MWGESRRCHFFKFGSRKCIVMSQIRFLVYGVSKMSFLVCRGLKNTMSDVSRASPTIKNPLMTKSTIMSVAVSTIDTVQDYNEQVNVSGYDFVFECFMSTLGVIWTKKSLRRSFEGTYSKCR